MDIGIIVLHFFHCSCFLSYNEGTAVLLRQFRSDSVLFLVAKRNRRLPHEHHSQSNRLSLISSCRRGYADLLLYFATFLPSMIYMPLAGASFSFIPLMEYIIPSSLRSWVAAFTPNVTPKSDCENISSSLS